MERPLSLEVPPTKVEKRMELPAASSLVTNASVVPFSEEARGPATWKSAEEV